VTIFGITFVFLSGLLSAVFIIKKIRAFREIKKTPALPRENLIPQNTIIVFDIHGVLFNHHYSSMLKQIGDGLSVKLIRCAFNPLLIVHSLGLIAKKSVPEAYIVGLSHQFPSLKPFVPLGITIANTQIPNIPVWNIVNNLKKNGYELHILSNIGETIFEDLRTKYPEIFSAFTSVKVANPQEQYIGKPNPLIFNKYLTEHNPANKQMVFIDDKPKNVNAAEKKGMIGIYFCCPSHLQSKLAYLGII
jgi:hypothetical protein